MGRTGDETTGRKIQELGSKWTIEKNESRGKKNPQNVQELATSGTSGS